MNNTKHRRKSTNAANKTAFVLAVQAAGMSLSAWVKDRLRRVFRKAIQDMDMPVAFLQRLSA
jgi:hypothetical protein